MAPPKRDPRTAYLDIVKRSVDDLVKRDRFAALEVVLDSTGYLFNRTTGTSAEVGAAIVALASVISLDDLRATAEEAAFERVFRRPNRASRARPGEAEKARRERAHRAASAARHGIDLHLVRGAA